MRRRPILGLSTWHIWKPSFSCFFCQCKSHASCFCFRRQASFDPISSGTSSRTAFANQADRVDIIRLRTNYVHLLKPPWLPFIEVTLAFGRCAAGDVFRGFSASLPSVGLVHQSSRRTSPRTVPAGQAWTGANIAPTWHVQPWSRACPLRQFPRCRPRREDWSLCSLLSARRTTHCLSVCLRQAA